MSAVEDFSDFVQSRDAFRTYFDRKDQTTDHSDARLRWILDSLDIGEFPEGLTDPEKKPMILDGETIYGDEALRGILAEQGPDYFVSHLIDYFELGEILSLAEEICESNGVVLKTDMKDIKGIFTKLFVRGKGVNDILRGMILCDEVQTFFDIAEEIRTNTKYNAYIKPVKEGATWPIPKLLVYNDKTILGRRATVELQFSTPAINNLLRGCNFHKVYEITRNSTQFASAKQNDHEFQSFLNTLNNIHCIKGFVPTQGPSDIGGFTIKSADSEVQMTGAVDDLITCGGMGFQLSHDDLFDELRISSFVLDGNLTVIGGQSLWSVQKYHLKGGKSIEFSVSFSGRGSVFVGLGTDVCGHGNEIGESVTVHVSPDKWWIRKNIFQDDVDYNDTVRGDQKNAKIYLYLNDDGILEVYYKCDENKEYTEVPMEGEEYHIFFMSWAGVHDSSIHYVSMV